MNSKQDPIRVVITIETRIYGEGIAQLLKKYIDIEIIALVSSLQETLDICLETSPNILLVDANFPETLSTIRKLKQEVPKLKMILLSMRACRNQMSNFAGEGVLEFVTRDDTIEDLRQTIVAAMKDGFWCSSQVAKLLLDRTLTTYSAESRFAGLPLTRQQTKVLQLLESGISNKEIACKLNIQATTVKNHVHHILQKLKVSSRGEAAAIYRRHDGDFSAEFNTDNKSPPQTPATTPNSPLMAISKSPS